MHRVRRKHCQGIVRRGVSKFLQWARENNPFVGKSRSYSLTPSRARFGDLLEFTRIGNDANPWNSLRFQEEFFPLWHREWQQCANDRSLDPVWTWRFAFGVSLYNLKAIFRGHEWHVCFNISQSSKIYPSTMSVSKYLLSKCILPFGSISEL